jgi:TolB-like protein
MNYIFQPKRIVTIIFLVISIFNFAQPAKVAILDFENTSGKTEYDALAKAISSMLITDLANNIHPKKVEFFERSQLNKLLDEQKLQKSKNFDAKTAVDFGKLSGVNYVFVGSVFVLDGTCNFSSKLVDVQTSKILLAKDVSGTIVNFLQLKSQLAEAIAIQLNNPITLDPSYKDQSTTLSTINQYGKILTTMDQGDAEKADQMRSLFEETNPEFKYFNDIKEDIEELKRQVVKNTKDIEVLKASGDLVLNATSFSEFKNNLSSQLLSFNGRFDVFFNMTSKFADSLINEINYNQLNFLNYFLIDLDFYFHPESATYIDGLKYQISILDTVKSNNQKKLILQLIREEFDWVLKKYQHENNFALLTQDGKEMVAKINENNLLSILKLYENTLNYYKKIVLTDYNLDELIFAEIFLNLDFVNQGYNIYQALYSKDTIQFKTNEFNIYRLNIINNFLNCLQNDYKLDKRVVKILKESSYFLSPKNQYFSDVMAFIYKKELEKTHKLDGILNKIWCYNNKIENATWRIYLEPIKFTAEGEREIYNMHPKLIINDLGISYFEN